MSGRVVVSALLVFLAVFGGALWYFQTRAFYERIDGLQTVELQGRAVAVADYRGIDADTSPIKLRACFTLDPADLPDLPPAPGAEPLVAPGWFDCFDAGTIARDLASGAATAYLAADETPPGATGYVIHRILAMYPDGRAVLWRQLTE